MAVERPRLTVWQKTCYSAGTLGHVMLDRTLLLWLVVFYIPAGKGASALMHPVAYTMIMFFGRFVDTVADPLIAKWSDSSHSRLGRRSVFMLWNGVPLAVCTVLAFYPPFPSAADPSERLWNAAYLALVLGGYFFFFTAYVAPYLALFTEIVTDYKERVKLGMWKGYFSQFGLIGGMMLSPVLLSGATIGGVDLPGLGYKGMIWAIAIPSVIAMYLPFAGINERRMCNAVPSSTPLIRSLLATLRNGPFVWFLVARQTFDFGFNMIVLALPYYTTLVLGKPEGYMAALFGGTFGVTLLSFVPCSALAQRLGKKRTMWLSMAAFALFLPALSVTDHPLNPVPPVIWAHVFLALSGVPLAITLMLSDPFIAAVSDLDSQATGQHRQAMYFGAQGFFSKLLVAASSGVALFVMTMFGTHVNAEGTPVPSREGVLLLGPVAAGFCLVGLWLFRRYPEKFDATTGEFYLDYDTSRMRAFAGLEPVPVAVTVESPGIVLDSTADIVPERDRP